MTWITKLKKLTEEQFEIIPKDWALDSGVDPVYGGYFILFEGEPPEVLGKLSRLMMENTAKKRLKTSVMKLLTEAKDADTVHVYTYRKAS